MYNIIPLLLILISLSVIIVIVAGKFSVLANLDVANIPAEKEAKFKERIISNRLKRNFIKWSAKLGRFFQPVFFGLGNFFKSILSKLYQLKNDSSVKGAGRGANTKEIIEQLFAQAEELKKHDDLAAAENKYIEIIGLESKNVKAFKELGRVYFEKKQYGEARETFEHVLKLKEDDEDIYENLAQIAKEKGNLDEARDEYLKSININKQNAQTHYNLACVYQAMEKYADAVRSLKKALNIEPANPKYLDTMLEISIIIKDKASALDAYQKLSKANPENNKIAEFKKQIDAL
ncbi:MAG: tetratricopeptide repeat protein [Patescibacteria group bacterium]|nr:tetratricopeptide repeat protein [Patescibacteria group bacterium]